MEEFVLGPSVDDVTPVNDRKQCPACGEFTVERDDEGCQLVCVSCGRILEEALLVSQSAAIGNPLGHQDVSSRATYDGFSASSLPRKYLHRNINTEAPGFRTSKRSMQRLAQALAFTPVMIEEAQCLFKASFQLKDYPNLTKVSIHNKETIAACCVYVVARRMGWPVAKSEIAKGTGRELKEVNHWFNILREIHGLDITSPDIEELVQTTFNGIGLPDVVLKTATDIIKLAKNVWIEAGRRPSTVLNSAAFIAYQAFQGCKNPMPLNRFCTKYKIKKSKAIGTCVGEIKDVVLRLGEELPWLGISDKNVHRHLTEILVHQKAVLHSIARQYEEQALENVSEAEEDEVTCPMVSHDKTVIDNCPSTCDIPTLKGNSATTTESTNKRGSVKRHLEDSDLEKGQGHGKSKIIKQQNEFVLKPRSFIRNRQKSSEKPTNSSGDQDVIESYNGDMNAHELSFHDIPENELHRYIKTEKEVKFARLMCDKE